MHTPGPWTVASGSVYVNDNGPIAIPIAHMDREIGNGTKPVERDANARLIAAAPSMKIALDALLLWCEDEAGETTIDTVLDMARTAVAEAKGE